MPTIPPRYAMYGYKSWKGVAPFQSFALCVKSWCRIFPRTISGISDTNLSAAPAHGRLKRSKIKKKKPNRDLFPILSKGRKAIISPISTSSKGKERHLTALNTARRSTLPLGRVGEGLFGYILLRQIECHGHLLELLFAHAVGLVAHALGIDVYLGTLG